MPNCKCGKDMFPFGVKEQKARYVCLACDTTVTLDPVNSIIIWGTHKELGIKVIEYTEVVKDAEPTQTNKTMGRSSKVRK